MNSLQHFRDVDLGYRPRPWQRQCHTKRKRFTVLALHRRAGKTELAIAELVNKAAKFPLDMGLFFYVAPFLKQAKIIAWTRLKQRLNHLITLGAVEVNESELSVRFMHNGAVIRIYGADNPDGMRGVRLDGVVIDEVAQIKPEVWTDILQPALADRKGWALFIGTPSGVNLFSELFYRAKTLPDWYSALYTVYDTNALDPDEVARLKRDMSEIAFARELLCDFTAAGSDQLISIAEIETSMGRVYNEDAYNFAPKILGVDPARFGDDRSTLVRRQGLVMLKPDVYRGIDNMALVGHITTVINDWKPDAVFCDAGNGSGVIDRIRQLGFDVTEVHFGGKASSPLYVNKRTEIWFETRDWIRAGGAMPRDTDLRQDLAAPTYHFDKQNRMALDSKDEIKAAGLPSPDLGDALALTFSYPVVKKNIYARPANYSRYDPYAPGIHASQNADYNPYDNLK